MTTRNIEFYFDPSCPWCWITSRWLTEVSESRDIAIDWYPFSLAIKNNELTGDDVTGHLNTHTIAHRVLRIIEAVHAREGIDRGVLYTEFGRAYFIDNSLDDDIFMSVVLEKMDLDPNYINEANNFDYDGQLAEYIKSAIDIVGDDVGVPLMVFVNEQGTKQGFFGPVISTLPDKDEGLALFDSLMTLGMSSHFFELKRTRTTRSKVKTTKRVFD